MVTTEGSTCPECSQKGKSNRLISVFFKSQEAVYTCGDKTCTYFLTDTTGNLVTFNKETNKTSYILEKPSEYNNDDDLNDFLNSLASNYTAETTNDYNFIDEKENRVPTSQSYNMQNFENENTNTFNVEFSDDSLSNFNVFL